MLVATLQKNAKLDEPLSDTFAAVPKAAKICRSIELQVLDDLHLDVAEDLIPFEDQIADLLWKHTGPDGQRIHDRLVKPLERAFAVHEAEPHVLTKSILEKILRQPLGF